MGGKIAAVAGALALVAIVLFGTHGREQTRLRADEPLAAAETPMARQALPPGSTTTTTTPVTVAAPQPTATTAATEAARDRVVFERSPQSVGNEALSLISYPWRQRLNVSITFAGPRPGYRATSTAYSGHDTITVYVRPTDTPRLVAVHIAHELGHLVDYHRLSDTDRREWLTARGRPDVTWWTCDYCADYDTGSGDFAETFAAWQVGAIDYRSRVAPLPNQAEMQSLARFFK